jgi:hypothetical protein
LAVIQFGSRKHGQLPAPTAGGLYNCIYHVGFVEASPSRALRDGEGICVFKFDHHLRPGDLT